MAPLIRRTDVLKVFIQMEDKCRKNGDLIGAEWISKCFNAVMCCKVENKIFCNECRKKIDRRKDSEGG